MSSSTMGPGTRLRLWLMTGVSYMIPIVAAGGIFLAIGFALGGFDLGKWDWSWQAYLGGHDGEAAVNLTTQMGWARLFASLGKFGLTFAVPVLAMFIAYAIADRPGLVPGFLAGFIAINNGSGFLGAIAGGLLAGAAAHYLAKLRLPRGIAPLMPVLIIPIVSSFIVAVLMITVIGVPVATVLEALKTWMAGLTGGNLALLGVLLGLMMAFDMGGPVNKVAYTTAVALLTEAGADAAPNDPKLVIMAIVMAAGMTPPLGLALATALRKNLFSKSERQAGNAGWVLGASFITEGAIPFAAADPIRVIPSIMIGSGVTGALVGLFQVGSRAPHGGIWVAGMVSSPLMWLLAVAIGTVVTALLVIVAKGLGKGENAASDEELEEAIA
ncbi:MAG TPA: PTS fructose transporter subunit IIC [Microbacteriaceae bacterium]|nr:PTS fructose transporter subunit IIC [Microbacteriaceae bacterium]